MTVLLRVDAAEKVGNLEPDVLVGDALLATIDVENRRARIAGYIARAEFADDLSRRSQLEAVLSLIDGRGFTG